MHAAQLATDEWNSINTGDIWSSFPDNVTSLAAEFNTYCRRWISFLGRPYKSTLQLSNFTKAWTKVLAVSLLRNFLILEIDLIEWKADLYICSFYLSKLRLESKITPMFFAWSVGLRLALASSLSLVSSRSQASEVLNAEYVCAVVSMLIEGYFMVTHYVPKRRCVHCVQ